MNLLFLHSSSDLYGASKILIAVTGLCRQEGHKVTVVLSNRGPLSGRLEEMGVEVVFLPLGVLRRKYINPKGILNRVSVMTRAYGKLKALCREKNIELIYSNTTGIIVGGFVARACGIRHLWHVHEIIEKPKALFRAISWMLNKKGTQVLVVSQAVKKHWARYVDPARITILYNGVDYEIFDNQQTTFRNELDIPQDAIVMGMMGRVHFWKGQDYFLTIAGILHKTFPELRFVLVGDPFPGYEYLYNEMDTIIENTGIRNRVSLVGYRDDIVNIFNSFDIFVLPSLLPDPAPAVVTEAMAASKAVVVTEQGGALEMIVAGESGIIIPLDNAERAAEKITPLLTDPGLRTTMGINARSRVVTRFSREVFNKAILGIIGKKL